MKKVLESLYDQYEHKSRSYNAEDNRIAHNVMALNKSLNRDERKLLLRIEDDKDLIIAKTSEDSFSNGVNIGVRLMLEVLYRA